jgi:RNA recognition motif-containing protein
MTIYVGNISYNLTEDDIRNIFEVEGRVESVKLIYDRNTGKSKGYAFVEMPDKRQAMGAIEELHGSMYNGRTLVVKQAHEKAKVY